MGRTLAAAFVGLLLLRLVAVVAGSVGDAVAIYPARPRPLPLDEPAPRKRGRPSGSRSGPRQRAY